MAGSVGTSDNGPLIRNTWKCLLMTKHKPQEPLGGPLIRNTWKCLLMTNTKPQEPLGGQLAMNQSER